MPKTKKVRKFSDVFAKYKTYDTSTGYGSPDEWRAAFAERMRAEVYEPILKNHALEPHDILGVGLAATWEEIRKAYRTLLMHYHPDRVTQTGLPEETATKQSKIINAAYSKLADRYGQ